MLSPSPSRRNLEMSRRFMDIVDGAVKGGTPHYKMHIDLKGVVEAGALLKAVRDVETPPGEAT
jgi:hypothetical protein